jgi:hypothetical protein
MVIVVRESLVTFLKRFKLQEEKLKNLFKELRRPIWRQPDESNAQLKY